MHGGDPFAGEGGHRWDHRDRGVRLGGDHGEGATVGNHTHGVEVGVEVADVARMLSAHFVAGGRERNIRSLQPLSLYPANSLFMEGYLTTDGQGANETHQMIEDLGFQIDQGTPSPATDFVDTISIA